MDVADFRVTQRKRTNGQRDREILRVALEDIQSEWGEDISSKADAVQLLRRAVIDAKERLSFVPSVTIDALGCQKGIAQGILDAGADYVLAVKDNQPTLHEAIRAFFAEQVDTEFANTEFANEHVALRTQLEQVVKGSFDASAVMATENATLRAQVKRLRELLVETRAFGLKPTPIQRGPLMVDWREERDKALADTQQEAGL